MTLKMVTLKMYACILFVDIYICTHIYVCMYVYMTVSTWLLAHARISMRICNMQIHSNMHIHTVLVTNKPILFIVAAYDKSFLNYIF